MFIVPASRTTRQLTRLFDDAFDRVFGPDGGGDILWVGLAILGLFVLRAVTTIVSRSLLTLVSVRTASAM